jgi:hypothetical protein
VGAVYRLIPEKIRTFEELGLLVSRMEGLTRVYYFDRNPVADDLRLFLRSTLDRLPESTIERFYRRRQRPRRAGKKYSD